VGVQHSAVESPIGVSRILIPVTVPRIPVVLLTFYVSIVVFIPTRQVHEVISTRADYTYIYVLILKYLYRL